MKDMRAKSNSYNLYLNKTYQIKNIPSICRILIRDYGDIPHKSLGLIHKNKLLIYTTDTMDFSEEYLHFIKYEKEQIYLQKNDKELIQDFRKDLKKLKIHYLCNQCVYKFSCPNIWQIDRRDLFGKSEKILKSILNNIRGDILDIGCGSINLYGDIIKKKTSKGQIRYTGIDKSKDDIYKIKVNFKSTINVSFRHISVEKFRFEHYDIIMLLRSINHIKDTKWLLQKCIKHLKPGGNLIIVDNIPYGLVRRNRVEIKYSKRYFEHFHNYDSDDIVNMTNISLRLIRHDKITRETANQWIVNYVKN